MRDTIPTGKDAKVRITITDATKGVRELDLADAEAEKLGGRRSPHGTPTEAHRF